MYLNGYVPSLQSGSGVVYFMRQHLGAPRPVDDDGGRLPHPFTATDRAAGYRYQLSIAAVARG